MHTFQPGLIYWDNPPSPPTWIGSSPVERTSAMHSCPLCDGKGGLGTFGPVKRGDILWKRDCPNCKGRCQTNNTLKCIPCKGQGGQGTFGACSVMDMHFESACRHCHGNGYTRGGGGGISQQAAPKPKKSVTKSKKATPHKSNKPLPAPFQNGRQIALESLHWPGSRLYAPVHTHSENRGRVFVWRNQIQSDVISKSRFNVEVVPGTNRIRLKSVHWNNGYLYTPDIASEKGRAVVCIWRGKPFDDPKGKTEFKVEPVDGGYGTIRLKSHFHHSSYLYAPDIQHSPERGGSASGSIATRCRCQKRAFGLLRNLRRTVGYHVHV